MKTNLEKLTQMVADDNYLGTVKPIENWPKSIDLNNLHSLANKLSQDELYVFATRIEFLVKERWARQGLVVLSEFLNEVFNGDIDILKY